MREGLLIGWLFKVWIIWFCIKVAWFHTHFTLRLSLVLSSWTYYRVMLKNWSMRLMTALTCIPFFDWIWIRMRHFNFFICYVIIILLLLHVKLVMSLCMVSQCWMILLATLISRGTVLSNFKLLGSRLSIYLLTRKVFRTSLASDVINIWNLFAGSIRDLNIAC